MKNKPMRYDVEYIPTGEVFQTRAVSEAEAINHIHYKQWFMFRIWTEMEDYEATPSIIGEMRKLLDDERRNQAEHNNARDPEGLRNQDAEQYVQLSFSW